MKVKIITMHAFVLFMNSFFNRLMRVKLMLAEGAQAALNLAGMMLGFYPVRVMPSKTAIAPVNPTFLPRVGIFLLFFLPKMMLVLY